MLKTIVLLILVVSAFTQLSQDKIILQLGLNGAFNQNSLSNPATIITCFDDASATETVNFISQFLSSAAAAPDL